MEAIIAAFLLLTSLLVVAALVDTSLQTQAKSEQYLLGSMVASNELDKLRGYATKFGMANLDGFDGQSFPSESEPGFQVRLQVRPMPLALPNSSLEAMVPEESRKRFLDSARFIKIRVEWSGRPEDAVEIASVISDWRERDFDIKLSAEGSLSLTRDGTVTLKAESGSLKDLVYTWYTEPLTGLGSIRDVARDGQSAVYIHRYRTPSNRFDYYPGQCRVIARAKFRNVVKTGEITVENVD